MNVKSSFITYELKKTKKIIKNNQSEKKKAKDRQRLIIQTKLNPENSSEKKILLVTFKQDFIQKIKNAIEIQKV